MPQCPKNIFFFLYVRVCRVHSVEHFYVCPRTITSINNLSYTFERCLYIQANGVFFVASVATAYVAISTGVIRTANLLHFYSTMQSSPSIKILKIRGMVVIHEWWWWFYIIFFSLFFAIVAAWPYIRFSSFSSLFDSFRFCSRSTPAHIRCVLLLPLIAYKYTVIICVSMLLLLGTVNLDTFFECRERESAARYGKGTTVKWLASV